MEYHHVGLNQRFSFEELWVVAVFFVLYTFFLSNIVLLLLPLD